MLCCQGDGGLVMSVCFVVKEMEGQHAVLSGRWRVSDVSVLCCQGDGGSVLSGVEGQCTALLGGGGVEGQ